MKLFTLFANLNGVREALQNPQKAGKEYLWGVIEGYLMVWGLWIIGITAVFGVLGFSSILNGPYLFFEVLFYLWLSLIAVIVLVVIFSYRLIKRKFSEFSDRFRKQKATNVEVIEVELIE